MIFDLDPIIRTALTLHEECRLHLERLWFSTTCACRPFAEVLTLFAWGSTERYSAPRFPPRRETPQSWGRPLQGLNRVESKASFDLRSHFSFWFLQTAFRVQSCFGRQSDGALTRWSVLGGRIPNQSHSYPCTTWQVAQTALEVGKWLQDTVDQPGRWVIRSRT